MEEPQSLMLVGGTILIGERLESLAADVLIEDGKIAALEPEGVVSHIDSRIVDVSGLTVIPGLIDCHTHLVLPGLAAGAIPETEPLFETILNAAAAARKTLDAGFTTARDLGGRCGIEFTLRAAIEAGHIPGPRLVLGGQIISITCDTSLSLPGMFREADTQDEIRVAVREQLKMGADVIKLMGSGALMARNQNPRAAHFSSADLRVAVEEARRHDVRVAVHAHAAEAIANALDAGATSIEHGTFLGSEPGLADRMASSQVFLVPTLGFHTRMVEMGTEEGIPAFMVEGARAALDAHLASTATALRAGVAIAFGTDSGSPFCFHGENARELQLMVDAGMTAREVLTSATSTAAACLGLSDEIGSIDLGKRADLVAIEGDPLDNVGAILDGIRLVVKAGDIVGSHLAPGRHATPRTSV